MGRRPALTPTEIACVQKLHASGVPTPIIAEAFGVFPSTIRYWTDEEFRSHLKARYARPKPAKKPEPPARSKCLEWLERWQAA